ncbi:hypothetical protein TUMEXPCC7403_19650 [Tumidithrix helvetica PCC 7403]
MEYDALNRLVKLVNPDPDGAGSLLSPEMRYEYDATGNKTAEIDPLGRKTQYQYDNRNRLIAKIYPDGSQETATYDANNNLIATTDANGSVTIRQYDASRRLVKIIEPNGIQTFEYNNNNQLTAQTNANGNRTQYYYDQLGRRYLTIDALGGKVYTSYDNLNRQIEAIDLLNQSTKTEYDAYGNVVAAIDPLGQRTSYGYDLKNRRNMVTDALGKVTTTTYDAFGNVLSITDPKQNKTSYEYSVKQTGKKIITNGSITSISYDGRYVALGIDSSLDNKDTNTFSDVFRLDRQTGQLIRVSTNQNGEAPNGYSFNTSISGDGRYVAFHSTSTNVDNVASDGLFVRDLDNGTTTRVASPIASSDPELDDFNKGLCPDWKRTIHCLCFKCRTTMELAG